MLHTFTDIHTHTPGRPGSILSVSAEGIDAVVASNSALPPGEGQYYSLELHPWHLTQGSIDAFLSALERHVADPHFVAIGECGLDGLCTTPADLQLAAFRTALQAAHRLGKPVIIHCVRQWSQLIAECRPYLAPTPTLSAKPAPPFIIHGFRKGPGLAKQLLREGFSLSLGKHYHPDVLPLIPPHRLYHETDED